MRLLLKHLSIRWAIAGNCSQSRKIGTAKPFTTKDTKEHKGDHIKRTQIFFFSLKLSERIHFTPGIKENLMFQNPL
jgi:hypothetical protein